MYLYTIFAILLQVLAGQGTHETCVLHVESIEYSELARMARLQGEVKVNVTIASDGKVVAAVSNSGHPLLRREAQENIMKWLFSPGEERKLEILYQFRLEQPEIADRPRSRVAFDLPRRVSIVSNLPAPTH